MKKKHLKELGVKCSVCGILCISKEKLEKHQLVKISYNERFN
jgi:hypothetical protein